MEIVQFMMTNGIVHNRFANSHVPAQAFPEKNIPGQFWPSTGLLSCGWMVQIGKQAWTFNSRFIRL
jgi:hypothetical protein